jgi:small-conductance mechanosensitive channel
MESRALESWIPIQRITPLIDAEPVLVLIGLTLAAWLTHKFVLKGLSKERHELLNELFTNLYAHLLNAGILTVCFWGMGVFAPETPVLQRVLPYVGLVALAAGTVVFIKAAKILVFEYLFLGHGRAGVPVLLVNLMTLILSLLVAGWIATHVFNVQLAPLLATSAIFSVVLGLALQETLGNLFAGISLQVDKPYEIGDWIELNGESSNWIGQVFEITWRATTIIGFADEQITIPNRVMAQSQISNFTRSEKPFLRYQGIKLPLNVDVELARKVLLEAVGSSQGVEKNPPPLIYVSEITESWILFRLLYYITDYGGQFTIRDCILSRCMEALSKNNIPIASQRVSISREDDLSA